jgi:hypothetical protein
MRRPENETTQGYDNVGKLKTARGSKSSTIDTRRSRNQHDATGYPLPEVSGRILPGLNSLTLTTHVAVNIDMQFYFIPATKRLRVLPVADTF